jgi:hypothetical protein
MIIQTLGAFFAVISFAILIEIPKKLVVFAGLTGMVGCFVFLLAQNYYKSIVAVAFISSMVISLLSHIFARMLKSPVSVFFVAGILPSVPGGSIYRSVYYLIYNETERANFYFIETLQIAGAIALAIFITDSFFKVLPKKIKK